MLFVNISAVGLTDLLDGPPARTQRESFTTISSSLTASNNQSPQILPTLNSNPCPYSHRPTVCAPLRPSWCCRVPAATTATAACASTLRPSIGPVRDKRSDSAEARRVCAVSWHRSGEGRKRHAERERDRKKETKGRGDTNNERTRVINRANCPPAEPCDNVARQVWQSAGEDDAHSSRRRQHDLVALRRDTPRETSHSGHSGAAARASHRHPSCPAPDDQHRERRRELEEGLGTGPDHVL